MASYCPPLLHCVLPGKLYIMQKKQQRMAQTSGSYRFFDLSPFLKVADWEEFGPENLSTVLRFNETFGSIFKTLNESQIVCTVDAGSKKITNAVFLLGAFLTLELGLCPDVIWDSVKEINLETYKSAGSNLSTIHPILFSVCDCWKVFRKCGEMGWLEKPSESGIWGTIIVDEYEHYISPLNGGLIQLVPEKLISFPSPEMLDGNRQYFDEGGERHFSAAYFAEILSALNVMNSEFINQHQSAF